MDAADSPPAFASSVGGGGGAARAPPPPPPAPGGAHDGLTALGSSAHAAPTPTAGEVARRAGR